MTGGWQPGSGTLAIRDVFIGANDGLNLSQTAVATGLFDNFLSRYQILFE